MAANWMRRTVVIAACASAALLAACGSSTTESAVTPERFIAFGDAMSDIGQNGTRYTVNDGSVNNWTLKVAESYGRPLASASSGGMSYAVGNARVKAKPDAAGNAATPTITEQVDAFLAGGSFRDSDLVFLAGGTSDVIAGMAAVQAGTQSEAEMLAAARQAGEDLAAQVQRLVTAGAKYVVVSGTYELGKSPWAKTIDREALLSEASRRFNDGLKINIASLGANVLYADLEYYVNLYTATPGGYGFSDATSPICTSVDPGNGIGIGAGQVNSALCNTSTLRPDGRVDAFVFADPVYLAPSAQRQFGTYTYDRLRERW